MPKGPDKLSSSRPLTSIDKMRQIGLDETELLMQAHEKLHHSLEGLANTHCIKF